MSPQRKSPKGQWRSGSEPHTSHKGRNKIRFVTAARACSMATTPQSTSCGEYSSRPALEVDGHLGHNRSVDEIGHGPRFRRMCKHRHQLLTAAAHCRIFQIYAIGFCARARRGTDQGCSAAGGVIVKDEIRRTARLRSAIDGHLLPEVRGSAWASEA